MTALVRVLLILGVGLGGFGCGWNAAHGQPGAAVGAGLLFLSLLWVRDGFEQKLRAGAEVSR